jgi:hypothetical protein
VSLAALLISLIKHFTFGQNCLRPILDTLATQHLLSHKYVFLFAIIFSLSVTVKFGQFSVVIFVICLHSFLEQLSFEVSYFCICVSFWRYFPSCVAVLCVSLFSPAIRQFAIEAIVTFIASASPKYRSLHYFNILYVLFTRILTEDLKSLRYVFSLLSAILLLFYFLYSYFILLSFILLLFFEFGMILLKFLLIYSY